jgi:hypothetical protein
MSWAWAKRSASMQSPVAIRNKPSETCRCARRARREQIMRHEPLGLELEAEVRDLLDGAARS